MEGGRAPKLAFLALVLLPIVCAHLSHKDRYIVSLKPEEKLDKKFRSWLAQRGIKVLREFNTIRAFVAYVPEEALDKLKGHRRVLRAEQDSIAKRNLQGKRHRHWPEGHEDGKKKKRKKRCREGHEQWGLPRGRQLPSTSWLPTFQVNTLKCPARGFDREQAQPWFRDALRVGGVPDWNTNKITICIVDSGIEVNHPDLLGNNFTSVSLTEEDISPSLDPNLVRDPTFLNPAVDFIGHGTAIAGVIAAVNNKAGTVGVIGNMRARIRSVKVLFYLDDNQVITYGSNLIAAVERCGDAKIISLSFETEQSQAVEQELLTGLYNQGKLIFSGSGDDGSNTLFYPAAYDNVISVSALATDLKVDPLSTANGRVQFTAPGIDMLTTAPTLFRANLTTDPQLVQIGPTTCASVTAQGAFLAPAFKAIRSSFNKVQGPLMDCLTGNDGPCIGAKGKVCLVERGGKRVSVKAQNCAVEGGIGVILYDNKPGEVPDNVFLDVPVQIPVLSILNAPGLLLKQRLEKRQVVMVSLDPGTLQSYAYVDGVSFASPAAAAVAALVWSNFLQCKNDEILTALQKTAYDIGPPKRDDSSGYGLLQALPAYQYLLQNPCKAYGKGKKRW